MTKLEAIAHLEVAFAHNQQFKKTFTDYIELCVIEAIEEKELQLKPKQQLSLAKNISNKCLALFQAEWWEAQGLK